MGRSRKKKAKKAVIIEDDEEEVGVTTEKKKRGRPKKNDKKNEETPEEEEKEETEQEDEIEIEDQEETAEESEDEEEKADTEDEIEEYEESEYEEEEEPEEVDEFDEEEDLEVEDNEEVWNAVEWDEAGPMDVESDVVFTGDFLSEIFKEAVDQAWEDGVITSDEMALLEVMKKKLKLNDRTFDKMINDRKPEFVDEALKEIEEEEQRLARVKDDEEEPVEDEEEEIEVEEEEDEVIQGEVLEEPMEYIRKDDVLEVPKRTMTPPPQPPEIITFSHSVRSQTRPLDRSFDLTKRPEEKITKRCAHCRALIKVDPNRNDMACPVCGMKIQQEIEEVSGVRERLDKAKRFFKSGDSSFALTLYKEVIELDPENKEAHFYMQKLKAKAQKQRARGDVRNIAFINSSSFRFDQLTGGGVEMGDTVLIEGPPFCGKEILLDQLMASALEKGVPVIYVSSNRAMKEVLHGIIKKVPDFKKYNKKGMIRMYDLFSKHKNDKVLKEGHRIFNIDDKEDFHRFQNDLVFVQEELVRLYHGGLLIINSLSPIISKVDQNDLMKFLQVLIARSKSYRFTNILDIAAGVHEESIQNSVEYLMDGIIEFRELDMKNMLRLKGFTQNILTRDWVEYAVRDEILHIIGSFMEERII